MNLVLENDSGSVTLNWVSSFFPVCNGFQIYLKLPVSSEEIERRYRHFPLSDFGVVQPMKSTDCIPVEDFSDLLGAEYVTIYNVRFAGCFL